MAALGPPSEGVWLAPRALYIHIPFCRSKCAYCDFFSLPATMADGEAMTGIVRATIARARKLAARFGAKGFDTVYVGGGTPSILPRSALRLLLSELALLAPSPLEWTVEANPESVDEEFLDILEEQGVSRLSIGVQSLDPDLLRLLARPAGAETSLIALGLASRRKLSLSADLIAGLPRKGGITGEVRTLVEAGMEHLSVYDLVLEEGTPLEGRWKRGEFELQAEDEALDERAAMESWLSERGLFRYEISNYALPGRESLHNMAYWRMDSYIGAGPGAVSTLARAAEEARGGVDGQGLRIEETRSIAAYRDGMASSKALESLIGPRDSAFEVMMMAFRTRSGLDEKAFERRFGLEVRALIGVTLDRWKAHIKIGGGRIALDPTGLDLGNGFLAACLLELETSFPAATESLAAGQTKKS